MTSILLNPIDLFYHVTGMPLMSTSLNQHQGCHSCAHCLPSLISQPTLSRRLPPTDLVLFQWLLSRSPMTHNAASVGVTSHHCPSILSGSRPWLSSGLLLDLWMLPLYLFVGSTTSSCLLSVGFPRLGPSPILFSYSISPSACCSHNQRQTFSN